MGMLSRCWASASPVQLAPRAEVEQHHQQVSVVRRAVAAGIARAPCVQQKALIASRRRIVADAHDVMPSERNRIGMGQLRPAQ